MLRTKENSRDSKTQNDLEFIFNGLDYIQSSSNVHKDYRYGSVKHGGETFEGVVLDLPCIIEVQKTLDNVNYYKSADIGQVLFHS